MSSFVEDFLRLPRFLHLESVPYTKSASINFDDEKFEAIFDVNEYKPDEISVEVNEKDNAITVEGEREGKRSAKRKYLISRSYDVAKVDCEISSDGVLAITAPRIEEKKGRKIKIKKDREAVQGQIVD